MPETTSEIAKSLQNQIDLKPGEKLYAVVDAAQDEGKLAFTLRDQMSHRIRMLFQGDAAQYLGDVAPYFVELKPETDFLELWANHSDTNPGILLTSSANPQKVFRHLREIFVVTDSNRQEHFFRFYDPRVFLVYLPTCTPTERKAFFGPINRFCVKGHDPEMWLTHGLSDRRER